MKRAKYILFLFAGLFTISCQSHKPLVSSQVVKAAPINQPVAVKLIQDKNEAVGEVDAVVAYRDSMARAMEGRPAKDFSLKDLQGKMWRLRDLRGSVVLVSFWFKTCPPCLTEITSLNQLQKDFGDKGLIILALSTDKASQLSSFIESKKIAYQVLSDANQVADDYEVSAFPSNFLIDKHGIIHRALVGGSDFDGTMLYRQLKPDLLDML